MLQKSSRPLVFSGGEAARRLNPITCYPGNCEVFGWWASKLSSSFAQEPFCKWHSFLCGYRADDESAAVNETIRLKRVIQPRKKTARLTF